MGRATSGKAQTSERGPLEGQYHGASVDAIGRLMTVPVPVQVAQGLPVGEALLLWVVSGRPDKLKHGLPHVCKSEGPGIGQTPCLSLAGSSWALSPHFLDPPSLTQKLVEGIGDRVIPAALEEGQASRSHGFLVFLVEIKGVEGPLGQLVAVRRWGQLGIQRG